jgi:nicotinate phosphoribosyltransferase
MENKTMLTDLYQLTMNAAYFDSKKGDDIATFELFIRKLPKDWGYFIANGIEDGLDYITSIKFEENDIAYLREQGLFSEEFLNTFKDFHFTGDVYAVKEGTPVLPNTPLVRITAKRSQAQFLESALLNIINSQTLFASKASRIIHAAKKATVVDFGLRRAQGADAAKIGARAAYIAGATGTSNVEAGRTYGIPIKGTLAHSFVMSFPNELDAFRAYVKTFPNYAALLIDSYDTLQGARNTVTVAKELEAEGKKLAAVRLDSGDLIDLSKKVREIFDSNGLTYVKILASNDLNEYKIQEHNQAGARIDGYGVGTEMITAKPIAAIAGVYKLVEDIDGPKIKLSSEKTTYPGKKQVYRVSDEHGNFKYDVLALDEEKMEGTPLLEKVIENGERLMPRRNLNEIRNYCIEQTARLPEHAKQVSANPYELKISSKLENLVDTLREKYRNGGA